MGIKIDLAGSEAGLRNTLLTVLRIRTSNPAQLLEDVLDNIDLKILGKPDGTFFFNVGGQPYATTSGIPDVSVGVLYASQGHTVGVS